MHSLLYETEFDLHEKEPVGRTHFYMNSFAQSVVWTHFDSFDSEMVYFFVTDSRAKLNVIFLKRERLGLSEIKQNCLEI